MALDGSPKIFPHLWYAREAEEAARCDADAVRSKRVTDALLKMIKLDIAALERAYRS